ncbi:MAG: FAD-binding protein [Caldilineaceae bacterium]
MRFTTIQEIQDALQQSSALLPHGERTKSALVTHSHDVQPFDLRALTGILEYEPGEFTFTARAGTPLREVAAALAEHEQYLPFDPPFVERGATLGGTVAAALSGSGRYRFGGVRDFLIGVRFVDGQGRHVRGGGKVVKNAAGFDLPKLMVGSLGQFGILTEVSFKVFPRPQAYQTLQVSCASLTAALRNLQEVVDSHFDLHALDLSVKQESGQTPSYTLWIRLGGLSAVLPERIAHIQQRLQSGDQQNQVIDGAAETALWAAVGEASWAPANASLVKVALTPGKIPALEAQLAQTAAQRRYAVGGNLAWIAWPNDLPGLEGLDQQLQTLGLSGLVLVGEGTKPLIGQQNGQHFAQQIKSALDPHRRLPYYY